MQLPRGRFRSLERGVRIGDILARMGADRFSGICTFSSEERCIEIVMEAGRIVLASVDTVHGDNAMRLISGLLEQTADVAISELTPAQLALAREFNGDCVVRHPEIPLGEKSSPPVGSGAGGEGKEGRAEAVSREETPQGRQGPEAVSPPGGGETQGDTGGEPPADVGEWDVVAREGFTLRPDDLDALDSMDLETMTRKIRENCRLMVERLQLGYLVADNEERGEG
ncbi:MAG: hypothetical protein QFX32_00175 [Methanolinea sp.]|nr:hypothetical protein [Methanolinea sp.]